MNGLDGWLRKGTKRHENWQQFRPKEWEAFSEELSRRDRRILVRFWPEICKRLKVARVPAAKAPGLKSAKASR
jgi:hypothetical protein